MAESDKKKLHELLFVGACIGFGVGYVTAALATRFLPKATLDTWLSLRFSGIILDWSIRITALSWIIFATAIGILICARIGHLSIRPRSVDLIIRSGIIASVFYFLLSDSCWIFGFGIMWSIIVTAYSIAYKAHD